MENNFDINSERKTFLLKKRLLFTQSQTMGLIREFFVNPCSIFLLKKEMLILKRKLQIFKKLNFLYLKNLDRLKLTRHPNRRHSVDYISSLLDGFEELHGDNRYGDDSSVICGFGMLKGRYICVISQEKGRLLETKVLRNFGCSKPSGYRKALRTMKKAEVLGVPILNIIDTAGAFPGIESEENNISEAISFNIKESFYVKVPIITLIIGEGGSGGALGIGISDKIIMLEYSYFSVISPEGCSSILWKNNLRVKEALDSLKLFSSNIKRFKVADYVISEPVGGSKFSSGNYFLVKKKLSTMFNKLKILSHNELIRRRFLKFRLLGKFQAV